jgi:TolB-like protein/class 3 adenylate cyclase
MARLPTGIVTFLFSDVEGSTELLERHGAQMGAALARHHELFEQIVATHHGAIFETVGDAVYAAFSRPSDAIGAVLDVHRALLAEDWGPIGRLAVRIAVNTGEVEKRGRHYFGQALFRAARLQALGYGEQTLVSGVTAGLVTAALPEGASLRDLGIHRLKDLGEPERVFMLVHPDLRDAFPPLKLPLPDKPSIAVLPFTNLSGDPEQDYFADGVVEDIITGLSRIKWVFVIARNSSFAYKGRAMDVKQVGSELGVRYVLEGSVRKSSNRVRITGQLIDTESGTQIWADRYDRALDDIFAVQDELTISVVGVIEPTLRKAEIERARRKRPDYASAHAIIAWCHEQRYLRGGLHEETKRAALRHARTAIAVGGDDAAALATAGFVVAVVEYDYETATAAFDRSFALSSSSALALGFSSIVRAWMGDDGTAVDQAERAIRLSPFDPLPYVPYIGLAYAHFAAGRFEEAAAAAGRASQSNPKFSMPLRPARGRPGQPRPR